MRSAYHSKHTVVPGGTKIQQNQVNHKQTAEPQSENTSYTKRRGFTCV